MTDLFANQWTLITGASSGLGAEFARQLAALRANLILTARSGDKLEALATELRAAHGISVEVIALDLAAPGGAARLCAAVDERGHAVEHLILNAGVGTSGPFADSKGEGERQTAQVRLNCEALVALSHHFLPALVARRSGGLLHVASVAGFQPTPYMAVYAATKAFVLNFSAALSEELRGSGVRVTALCPGPVPTGFQEVAGLSIPTAQAYAVLSAAETVRRGLRAYAKGRAVYIPGGLNRVGAFSSKLLPRSVIVRMVAKMMRKPQRPQASR